MCVCVWLGQASKLGLPHGLVTWARGWAGGEDIALLWVPGHQSVTTSDQPEMLSMLFNLSEPHFPHL